MSVFDGNDQQRVILNVFGVVHSDYAHNSPLIPKQTLKTIVMLKHSYPQAGGVHVQTVNKSYTR